MIFLHHEHLLSDTIRQTRGLKKRWLHTFPIIKPAKAAESTPAFLLHTVAQSRLDETSSTWGHSHTHISLELIINSPPANSVTFFFDRSLRFAINKLRSQHVAIF